MIYHGGTCLLTINLSKILDNNKIYFNSKSYGEHDEQIECKEAFSSLIEITNADDPLIPKKVSEFLMVAVKVVGNKYYDGEKSEGFWSSKLSIDYGQKWEPSQEWLIIDREAVIGFNNGDDQKACYTIKKEEAKKIKDNILAKYKWAQGSKSFGDELDFLAIGPDRQLVCIELKYCSNVAGIYWGPLQTSVYQKAFEENINVISESIINMVRSKIALGLLPKSAEKRIPQDGFKMVQGVLAVAGNEITEKSRCWQRSMLVNNEMNGNSILSSVKMVVSNNQTGTLKWEDFPQ